MRKVICVIAVMGLTVAWGAQARAARHSLNLTITIVAVKQAGPPPSFGSPDSPGRSKGALG